MSELPFTNDQLIQYTPSGAQRSRTNPRIHTMSKPYSRPSSFAGPSTTQPRGTSPTKPAPSTRALPTSTSTGSLTRSGSEGSLFSTLKSAFSRPIAWLTTPSKPTSFQSNGTSKRDSTTFGTDPEEPASPSDRHTEKRQRISGDYEPDRKSNHIEVQGRAIEGRMLPPLPPSVSLTKNRSSGNVISTNTNFSRPLGGGGLASSKSMPYLDPPPASLGGSRGVLSRSSRLGQLADFGEEEKDVKGKGKEVDRGGLVGDGNWSPWKERYVGSRVSMTPTKRNTPARLAESRDYTLPSLSPFRPPPSPSHSRQPPTPTTALGRSNTTANLRRGSVASDVSMGGSQRIRQSSSMLFGAGDDRMSVDGDREKRDGSVLDWFMKDRWAPASPASRAASMRLGSVAPSAIGGAPIRKGQMVWTADKGFMRESELKASAPPQPVHKNDAEKLLFSLEALRKTPLTPARTATSSFGESMPQSGSSLFGASSRQIRRVINVPLSTAQAGESARERRERERRAEGGMSMMISPYGRRRQVDDAARDGRRQRKESESQREYAERSESAAQPARSQSHAASDHSMKSRESAKAPSPSPQPTPRRSSRLKRAEAPPSEDESMATPKTKRSTKKAPSQPSPSPKTKETPRRTRKRTAEKGTSPEQPPAPPLPTITETAPSPSHTSSDTYAPLAEGHQRSTSALRAKSGITKRTHVPSAGVSRANSPSTGKFSAREEDLPDMQELEQTKIQLPSFSGITFGNMDGGLGEKKSESTIKAVTEPVQPAQPAKLSVPTKPGVGPLGRLNSSRPRASSPLAGGSIVAQPDSPENTPAKSTAPPVIMTNGNTFFPITNTTTAPVTAAPSLFANLNSNDTAKKTTGLGLGKPPAQPEVPAAVPNFFGSKSQPTSGTSTPAAAPAPSTFSFGLSTTAPAKAEELSKIIPSDGTVTAPLFSFNTPKPAEPPKTAEAPKPLFALAPTPSEAAKPAFSFGAPGTAVAEPPKSAAEPAKPAFSFGAPAAPGTTPAPAPAPSTKPAFSFGAPSAAPASAPVPTPSFSFGATSTPAAPVSENTVGGATQPNAKPAFNFGATNAAAPKPAEPSPALGGFNFNKPAELMKPTETSTLFGGNKPAAAPTGNGFSFGGMNGNGNAEKANGGEVAKPANPFGGGSTPSFTFGAPQTNGMGNGFGAAPAPSPANAVPSTPFGAPAANPPTTPFTFGAPPNANPFNTAPPAPSTGFAFGSNNAAPVQNGFGAPPAQAQPAAGGFNFSFNSPSATPVQTPSFAFGQQNQPGPGTPTSAGNGFAFGAPPAATPSFAFGAGGNGGGFGAPNNGGGFGGGSGGGAPQQQKRAAESPAPSGDGSGFSMGAAGDTPGSPGARKIKGLRRGGSKR